MERELGRGGMGVVYLATDPRLRRPVAIKALPDRYAQDPGWQKKLAREAEVLGALSHPHIAVIYERLDIEGHGSYLVMEYVEGQSLRQRLGGGALQLGEACRVGSQLAAALEAAHNRSIVHRDIKPENIQLTPESHVKVLDFGIAVETAAGPTPADAPTRVGGGGESSEQARIAGTPGYMSPEQARCRPVDRRADIFAFGCVLFECLSGCTAFEGDTAADRIAAVLMDDPDWTRLPESTPDSIREMLAHCLEKNISDRLRDIADARYVLDSVEGRRPTPAKSRLRPPTPHNLPTEMLSFIGREEAIERLRALLRTTRLLTLGGPAGCGKTSIALKVAGTMLEDCPDGVWFVDLSGTEDPKRLLETIAATLRVTAPPERSPLEFLGERLRDRRTLLVLDNCEHLVADVAGLVDALLRACPDLRVLATSRELLGLPGEQVYFVPPLTLPGEEVVDTSTEMLESEAVRLFVERARLVRSSFSPSGAALASVARICLRLDGIPLAIELAAARIKMLTPEQIEEKLSDRFRLLTGRSGTGAGRHSTLRTALDWSYRLLTEEDRRSLHRLEVFVGGWSLEAASAVLGSKEMATLDVLTRLADKSLVVTDVAAEGASADDSARYRLLESVREYLRQLRAERVTRETLSDWLDACERHLVYYDGLAAEVLAGLHGTDAEPWRRLVVAERGNFIAAQRFAFERAGSARALAITDSLRRVWRLVFGAPSNTRR